MDHDYELASYDRTTAHIHDKERLSKPISYWRSIAPNKAEAEEAARTFAEESKSKKRAKKGEEQDQEARIEDAKARQLAYRGLQY
jgi:NADH-quinone oxidoreductase subunit I